MVDHIMQILLELMNHTDISVVKVDADLSLLHRLSIGDSSNLKVGEEIASIGNPFGLAGSMTSGIISQLW